MNDKKYMPGKRTGNLWAYIILGIVLLAWLAIALVVPFERNETYWLSFGITLLAFAFQPLVLERSFRSGGNARSKFYGFPIIRIGVVYLVVQLALGLVMMILAPWLPLWVALILQVVALAVAAVGCVAADTMRNEVERQDTQLKRDVSTMRMLQSKTRALVGLCNQPELCAELQDLADEFRFSDPVSSETLDHVEASLTACVNELQRSLVDGDLDSAAALCRRTKVKLAERNRLCKLNK